MVCLSSWTIFRAICLILVHFVPPFDQQEIQRSAEEYLKAYEAEGYEDSNLRYKTEVNFIVEGGIGAIYFISLLITLIIQVYILYVYY